MAYINTSHPDFVGTQAVLQRSASAADESASKSDVHRVEVQMVFSSPSRFSSPSPSPPRLLISYLSAWISSRAFNIWVLEWRRLSRLYIWQRKGRQRTYAHTCTRAREFVSYIDCSVFLILSLTVHYFAFILARASNVPSPITAPNAAVKGSSKRKPHLDEVMLLSIIMLSPNLIYILFHRAYISMIWSGYFFQIFFKPWYCPVFILFLLLASGEHSGRWGTKQRGAYTNIANQSVAAVILWDFLEDRSRPQHESDLALHDRARKGGAAERAHTGDI